MNFQNSKNKQIGVNKPLNFHTHVATIIQHMKQKLEAVTSEGKEQKAALSIQLAFNAAAALKEAADQHEFDSDAEEITFYKKTYPAVLAELYYFRLKFDYESNSPVKNDPQKVRYLQAALSNHQFNLSKQHCLNNYIDREETYQDEQFFCRHSNLPTPPDIAIGLENLGFPCDYYAHKIGWIKALIRHMEALQSELTLLNVEVNIAPTSKDNVLRWTGTKVALIELIYALYEKESINKGQVTLKQLFNCFEKCFNIKIAHYASLYKQSICLRKKNRTKYLDALVASIIKRMDKYDERPSRL